MCASTSCSSISAERNKHLVDVITALLGMIFCVLVIWLVDPLCLAVLEHRRRHRQSGGIEYRYIVKALIPIGFAIYFLQSLSEAIKSYLAYRAA